MRYLLAVLAIALVAVLPACAMPVLAATHETMAPPFALRFDLNGNNMIEKSEVLQAIEEYLFYDDTITRSHVLEVIEIYLFEIPIQEQVAPPSLAEVAAQVMPAVVKIVNDETRGQGSGAIYKVDGQNGYIITNEHVVTRAATATVTVGNATDYEGTVLGVDADRDLAVVRICCNAAFPTADFGDSEELEIGDEVLAVGYPEDALIPKVIVHPGVVSATVTRGIVSAVRYDSDNDRELVQTDAPLNQGNSGGPLFAMDGTIIGIVTFGIRDTEGLNFAVLETTVQKHLATLEAGTSPAPGAPRLEFEFYPFAGPWPGHIHHEPDDLSIEIVETRFQAADAVVSARFHNPYDGSQNNFDYGFILRDDAENPSVAFVVHSDGIWEIRRSTDAGFQRVAGGTAPGLEARANWGNFLVAGVVGDWGWFRLNGQRLADSSGETLFNLGVGTHAGAVQLVTGFFTGDEQQGAETGFDSFLAEEIVTHRLVATTADAEKVIEAHRGQTEQEEPVQERELQSAER